jgi:ATP-dependent Zn protease
MMQNRGSFRRPDMPKEVKEFEEKVVQVNRVSKKTKRVKLEKVANRLLEKETIEKEEFEEMMKADV